MRITQLHGLIILAGLLPTLVRGQEIADKIYHGGDIVTVDDKYPSAEAVAIRAGKILAVGSKADLLKLKGETTQLVDLQGKTLLPGFIDGHSHFINSLSVSRQANCFAPPSGPGKSIAAIIAALKATQKQFQISKGDFIIGYGYDGNAISDGREMTAADLDAAFPDNPVFVQHVSLHGAVCNSLALKKFNVTQDTKTPPGGVIVRKPNSTEPAGLLMEAAWMPIFENLPKPSESELLTRFKEGQMIYAAAGITTAQEGATFQADVALLQKAAKKGELFIDVVSYPFITEAKKVLEKNPP
jgi:predicted amidohydrolase YtcJ